MDDASLRQTLSLIIHENSCYTDALGRGSELFEKPDLRLHKDRLRLIYAVTGIGTGPTGPKLAPMFAWCIVLTASPG
jgi:hypothetical protein